MNSAVFGIDRFNVIEDEEYYYVFRALNNGDHFDIEENITNSEDSIARIRTDRERRESKGKTAKYSQDSDISLEEVWDHIKIKYLKETNCISLSSNANVILDYGQSYNNEYVMVKVPKKNNEKVYPAGQYMLAEIENKINELMASQDIDSNVFAILSKIDNEEVSKNISQIVSEIYKQTNTGDKKHITEQSLTSRFDKKQYFSEEQQLEYDKVIAKLTVLELYDKLKSILPTQLDNTSLIATVGIAFGSGELIHYKDIEKNEFVEVSKEMMEALALFQQLKDKEPNNEEIKALESKFIEFINSGNRFNFEEQEKNDTLDNFNIENMYKLTQGKIPYEKARIAVEFAQKVSESKLKASEYAKLMQETFGISDELAEKIRTEGFAIDKDIISREDNIGFKVAESVNIGLTREQRRLVSNREQLAILNALQNLSGEQIQNIAQMNGLELESTFLDKLLESKDEITENEYFAESIVDGIDFEKVYKKTDGKRDIDDQERQKLIEKLKSVDCKRIYSVFANMGKNHNVSSQYIINLLIDGYKGMDLEEISRMDNLEEFIIENKCDIKPGISPVRLDRLLGIEDDAFAITGTGIRLRDYQKETLDNINEIFEEKRFAGMVLPTGAGKSFVAMSEMLRYKNSKIVFIAPQETVWNQFNQHIERTLGKDYFPHLTLFCYKTLEKANEEFLANLNADLIIFDEAHRTGAPTWEPKIKKMLEKNPNAKILGMTATPERDVDHKDMMSELARICGGYSAEEINRKKHLSSEMDVLDAMQDDIVVTPKVVTFDYTLDQSDEYLEVKQMLEEEKDPEKKEKLETIYKEMTAIISKAKLEGMNKVFNDNIQKKNGRYIVFVPHRPSEEVPIDKYMEEQIETIKGYFKDIDPNPSITYLASNREGGKRANMDALEQFEDENGEHSEHLKLIIAVDKLNEGVHVNGIDGEIMLRPIDGNSKIVYKQQIGRCIYSLDPNKPINDEDRPIIFDVYNNYLTQNMHREANRTTTTSDLERLKRIANWIERHKGYMPDINSEDTKEAKMAIALKNIQKKYKKYLDGIENKSLSESQLFEIESILELGKTIDFWELEIPDRIVPPGEKEISKVDAFKVTGTQKDFVDLFREAKGITKDRKLSDKLRVKNTFLVFDLLTEYGIEINNNSIGLSDTISDVLAKIPEEIRLIISEELEENGIDNELKIGEEYNFVKSKFFYGAKLFEGYKLDELYKLGVLESFCSKDGDKKQVDVNWHGFLEKNCPSEFKGLNLKTGTDRDEAGYNKEGRDEDGYSRAGWDRDGYGRDGFNGRGWDRDGYGRDGFNEKRWNREHINKYTNTKYDRENYDEDGFNPEGWNRAHINKYTNTKYDRENYDEDGFNPEGWNREHINKYTNKKYDKERYDEDGFNPEGWNREHINKYTNKKYDREGYDEDGFNENGYNKKGYDREGYDENQFDKNGIHKITKTKYDLNHLDSNKFDKDGYSYEKQEDGTYKNTGLKYNKFGFRADNRHVIAKEALDLRGFNIKGICKKNKGSIYDKNGFKQDGTYMETGEMYHEGYNAWGVDKEGRLRNGTLDPSITFVRSYIKALEKKEDRVKYIKEAYPYVNKENFNEVMDRVYREIEVASQKCPIIKDEIQKFLTTQKRMVVEAMIKMRKLQQENGDKKKEIEELTQIIQESKQKINYIAPKER